MKTSINCLGLSWVNKCNKKVLPGTESQMLADPTFLCAFIVGLSSDLAETIMLALRVDLVSARAGYQDFDRYVCLFVCDFGPNWTLGGHTS